MTVKRWPSRASTGSQLADEFVIPWTRTSSGPRAADPVAELVPVEMDLGGLDHRRQRICTPEIARAMTSRWISDVPSKIV